MMKRPILWPLWWLSFLLAACATTEVDLCYGEHPHRSDIDVYFDFGEFRNIPDSMVVFAVRNLNLLRYTYHLNTEGRTSTPAQGTLLYPSDLREPAYTQTTDAEGNIVSSYTGGDFVRLHAGDYDLVAFSGGSDTYFDNLSEVMFSQAENIDSLWVNHRSYATTLDHPALGRYSTWVSHNVYSRFILHGDQQPTFAAQTELSVPVTEEHHRMPLTFHTTNLSQHIILEFRITKDPAVVVDSVVAELSGIPHRMYLMTGAVAVDTTFKTLFCPDVRPAANLARSSVTVRGNLYVNGLVRSADRTYTTGPGVLWVCVYAHTTDSEGNEVSRPVEACINLYSLLQNNPSLVLDENDEPHQVSKELRLTVPDAILDLQRGQLLSKETSGLDIWRTLPDGQGNIGVDM